MNRIKWAEKKAYQLLDTLKINDIPVPVEEIPAKLNITLTHEEFGGNLSGVLYRDDSHIIIGVNSSEPETRQRFTIAHEIGHFLMHEGEQVHIDHKDQNFRVNYRDMNSSLATDMNEIEANAFAAVLLMPEHLIRKALVDLNNGIDLSADSLDDIKDLAKKFNVSQQALLIRLGKLGLLV